MLAAERKLKIIEHVKKHQVASVTQLAQKFQVHEATIRRDLAEIEQEGYLKRTHGGVVIVEDVSSEPVFSERENENIAAKQRIGKVAADSIQEGEHIILDSGTTALQIAKNLVHRSNITVVTNDINIAAELRDAKGIQVLVTGGILFPESFMLNGMFTDGVLKTLHVHKAFISVPAIHHKFGITHFDAQIVPAKIGMINAAQETIVVADHTKIGKVSLHTVAPIEKVHTFITDSEVLDIQVQQFKEADVDVIIV